MRGDAPAATPPRPRPSAAGRVLVIGCGNPLRGDDRAGIEFARRLTAAAPAHVRVARCEGEPIALLEMWEDVPRVLLIDAMKTGAPPGTIHRFDAAARPLPARAAHAAGHTLGLAAVIELARRLGRLPPRVTVFGIEGAGFALGDGLSPAVKGALPGLVRRVLADLASVGG